LKLKTTLSPFWVTLFSTDQAAFRSRAEWAFNRLNVNSTSAAVSGLPSVHFRFGRIVNVSVWLLLLHE
jgi:hypothetical protein